MSACILDIVRDWTPIHGNPGWYSFEGKLPVLGVAKEDGHTLQLWELHGIRSEGVARGTGPLHFIMSAMVRYRLVILDGPFHNDALIRTLIIGGFLPCCILRPNGERVNALAWNASMPFGARKIKKEKK